MTAPHVYAAIVEVTATLAKAGISKDRKNSQQGYAFRGIDDIYNALAPALVAAKLCILPRVVARSVTEHASKAGGILFNVVLEVEFDMVSAVDGSSHVARSIGEAMDSGDKATNKAMSAAYKYVAMQTFCIPTEGDNDSENQTHQVDRRISPYPDMSAVDPELAEQYAVGIKVHASNGDAAGLLGLHRELNTDENRPLYAAVGRLLNTKEKAALRAAVHPKQAF